MIRETFDKAKATLLRTVSAIALWLGYERQAPELDAISETVHEPEEPAPAPEPIYELEEPAAAPETVYELEEAVLAPEPRRRLEQTPKIDSNNESFGQWQTLSGLLDKLDDYFKYLGLLKKSAPEIYSLYSKVGAKVISESFSSKILVELPVGWQHHAPTFGMAFLFGSAHDTEKDWCPLRFAAINKFKHLKHVLSANNVCIYEVVLIHTLNKYKNPTFGEFHVAVDADGKITLLKEMRPRRHALPQKSKLAKRTHRGDQSVTRKEWCYPAFLYSFVADQNKKHGENHTVEQYAEMIFNFIMFSLLYSTVGARVNIAQGDEVGVFNIDVTKTAHFFSKRDKQVTENGRTKPIFHAVMAHARRVGDKTKYVKMHFRGLRDFMWRGYHVRINIEGIHQAALNDFEAHALEETSAMKRHRDRFLTLGQCGNYIKEHIWR